MEQKFNYCIGHFYADGRLSTYAYGSETFFGTQEDAEGFLSYVNRKSPEHPWQIVKIPRIEQSHDNA